MDNTVMLYIISGILAFIPTIIWLRLVFDKSKRTNVQALIFGLSIFSVVPIFILHYFLNIFPQLDILQVFEGKIGDQNLNFILLFISVGIVEEIAKQLIIRLVDKKYLLIHTINESVHYSIIAALGFAFAENIVYIYAIYTSLGIEQLIIPYLFRSIFTTLAHIIFSGFFGYYYGISKFATSIMEQARWTGKKYRISKLISRILNISRIQGFKEFTILKGLTIAIIIHTIFNFLLQLNQILPVLIFISISAFLLFRKFKKQSGKLNLIIDPTEQKKSSMEKSDEEVVIELLGMWLNDKRYVDVVQICERLIEKDPDNKIIQLFKAQALDKVDSNSTYGKILKNIFPKKNKKTVTEMIEEKTAKKEKVQEPKPIQEHSVPSEPPKEKTEEEKKEDSSGTFNLEI